MKFKVSLLFIFMFSISYAQLALTTVQGNTPIADGSSFDYDTTIFEDAKLKFKITNTSATETINVLAQMVSFTNTDGTNLQFCVQPNCFFDVSPGDTIPNNPIVLAPGADNGNFDYFSNTNPGDGINYPMTYTLRFFMVDDNGQIVGDDITITYNYTPANFSTSNFSLEDLGITLHNTLISQTLNFDTNQNISFKVFDINGREINSSKVNAGQHEYNMSQLNSGHYVLVFNDNSGRKTQVRIQKR